jgi:hypothetical protein
MNRHFTTTLVGYRVKMLSYYESLYRYGANVWMDSVVNMSKILTPKEMRAPRPVIYARLKIDGDDREIELPRDSLPENQRWIGARVLVYDNREWRRSLLDWQRSQLLQDGSWEDILETR